LLLAGTGLLGLLAYAWRKRKVREMAAILGVVAIVVFAAGSAEAYYLPINTSDDVTPGGYDASFYPETTMNDPWLNTDPNSDYDGAIWINSGSGPVMLTTPVNAQLLVDDTDASWGPTGNGSGGANGWVEEVLLLNSDGSSVDDFGTLLPGTFNPDIPEQGVPGTFWKAYDNASTRQQNNGFSGAGEDTNFEFQLLLWTGEETTYAQAVADGQYTADASWLQTVDPATWKAAPGIPGDIDNPAMILTVAPTPEPSTLLLAGTGLLGLLACAWTKRK
jgi:hypothetical protein